MNPYSDAEIWEASLAMDDEAVFRGFTAIADYGPQEDWSDWIEALDREEQSGPNETP